MELKITTQQMLKLLQLISWIIFIGLCVEAGAIVFNLIYTLASSPANKGRAWDVVHLSGLYRYDHGYFMVMMLFVIIVAVLKAFLFYLIVKLFVERKLNMARPFNVALKRFLLNIAYLALGIGLFAHWGCAYAVWLATQHVVMPGPELMNLDGAGVWLFMAIILFVIAQVVKRGIEVQTENDLTI